MASLWVLRQGRPGDEYRFDVVAIQDIPGGEPVMEHIADAWRLTGQSAATKMTENRSHSTLASAYFRYYIGVQLHRVAKSVTFLIEDTMAAR